MATGADQLDMFDEHDKAVLAAQPFTCLYSAPVRGLAARLDLLAATAKPIHGWRLPQWEPTTPADRCQATALMADVREWTLATKVLTCDCTTKVNELMYRGACLKVGCDWEGDPRTRENPAVEDAMDHAWPGWRNVPVVPHPPYDPKNGQRWLARAIPLYPPGWIENGGPVRTLRDKGGTRHHGPATPCGGYDMAAIELKEDADE